MAGDAAGGRRSPAAVASWVFVVVWLLYAAATQWSVVRFRVVIVLALTVAAVAVAVWLGRHSRVALVPVVGAAVLAGSALVTASVPLWTYVRGGWLIACYVLLIGLPLAVAGAVLTRPHRVSARALVLAAIAGQALLVTLAVLGDRAPRIDVWVVLQQASDVLGQGHNIYAAHWVGSPGDKDSFPYLPWTAVLLAPGRWLAGDVRWALGAWTLVSLAGFLRLCGPRRNAAVAAGVGIAAVALIAFPGTLTLFDQAWTEPLLFTGILWWALLVREDRAWWAVVPLGLALASKQHVALLLPLALVWRRFGVARTLATGALAGLLSLPWFLASPRDFIHDAVSGSVQSRPLRFADTWYLVFYNDLHLTLPFWVVGVVVLGVLAAAVMVVRRRQPGVAELLRWGALVLLVANVVNKQAFYNQYWLSAALVIASVAVDAAGSPELRQRRAAGSVPATPA